MATITITFQNEDALQNFDLSQYGSTTSRSGPAATGEPTAPGRDLRGRQSIVVINSGAITLAEVQRALRAAKVPATAV